jgi:hypothetical protein
MPCLSFHMNRVPATVYPDVDAAAHVWADPIDEDSDSWVLRQITFYCDNALETFNDETLSGPYKVGYAKATIKGIKRLIEIISG